MMISNKFNTLEDFHTTYDAISDTILNKYEKHLKERKEISSIENVILMEENFHGAAGWLPVTSNKFEMIYRIKLDKEVGEHHCSYRLRTKMK